jgi:hypothetical protein
MFSDFIRRDATFANVGVVRPKNRRVTLVGMSSRSSEFSLQPIGGRTSLSPQSYCHPFRVRSWVGSIPGVKTPGSVLLSLRDKSHQVTPSRSIYPR